MWPIFIFLILISVGIGFYLYRYLRRVFETFGAPVKSKTVRIVLIVLSVCLAGLCLDFSGFGFLVTMHIFVFALILQFVNFIVKRFGWSWWKKIYGSGILPVVLTAVFLVFGYFNLHNVVATEYTVNTKKDIREEGYKVALIADVHFGVSLDYEELMVKCQEISREKPDIVVLCGDIVDNDTSKEEMHQVFEAFGKIESEYGVFYVHGNHDRPMGVMSGEYSEEDLVHTIEENDITILQDDVVKINEDLVLIGREDKGMGHWGAGRASLEELSSDVDAEDFVLTLDHQPNSYEETGTSLTDLVLSGHTHGGQLWPLKQVQELFKLNDGVYGHMWIDDDTQAIVTSGLAGWAYPVKTAAPAEYVIIDIVKKS